MTEEVQTNFKLNVKAKPYVLTDYSVTIKHRPTIGGKK